MICMIRNEQFFGLKQKQIINSSNNILMWKPIQQPNIFQILPNNMPYKICSALNTNKCLEVSDHNKHKHQIMLHKFNDHKNQMFTVHVENGLYNFKSCNGEGAIHVADGNDQNGGHLKVGQQNYPFYYFQLVPVEQGEFKGKGFYIRTFAGKALDVSGGKPENNTPIIQWDYHGGNNQIWLIVPAVEQKQMGGQQMGGQQMPVLHFEPKAYQPYKIVSMGNSGFTLRAAKDGHMKIHTFEGHNNEKFYIEHNNGKYLLRTLDGDVVHVGKDSPNNGEKIVFGKAHNHACEYWDVVPATGPLAGKGWLFRSFAGKAFDVDGGNYKNGTHVIQWEYNGGNNQIWGIVPI